MIALFDFIEINEFSLLIAVLARGPKGNLVIFFAIEFVDLRSDIIVSMMERIFSRI